MNYLKYFRNPIQQLSEQIQQEEITYTKLERPQYQFLDYRYQYEEAALRLVIDYQRIEKIKSSIKEKFYIREDFSYEMRVPVVPHISCVKQYNFEVVQIINNCETRAEDRQATLIEEYIQILGNPTQQSRVLDKVSKKMFILKSKLVYDDVEFDRLIKEIAIAKYIELNSYSSIKLEGRQVPRFELNTEFGAATQPAEAQLDTKSKRPSIQPLQLINSELLQGQQSPRPEESGPVKAYLSGLYRGVRRHLRTRRPQFQLLRDCFIVRYGQFYLFYLLYDDIDFTLRDYIAKNQKRDSMGGEMEMLYIAESLATSLEKLRELGLAYNNVSPENVCVQIDRKSNGRFLVLSNFENCVIKTESFKNMQLSFNRTEPNIKRKSIEINNQLETTSEDVVSIVCNPILSDVFSLGLLLLEVKLRYFVKPDNIKIYYQHLNYDLSCAQLIILLLNDNVTQRIKYKKVEKFCQMQFTQKGAPESADLLTYAESDFTQLKDLELEFQNLAFSRAKRRAGEYSASISFLSELKTRAGGKPKKYTFEENALAYYLHRELSFTFRDINDYALALKYNQECLNILYKWENAKQIELANMLFWGCQIQNLLKKNTACLNWYKTAIQLMRKIYGTGSSSMLKVINAYGEQLRAKGDLTGALQCYQECLIQLKNASGFNGPYGMKMMEQTGEVYFQMSDYNNALMFCRRALRIKLSQMPKAHYQIAESLNNCGECHRVLGHLETAQQYYEKALKIVWGNREQHPAFLALLYNNLGLCLKRLNQMRDSLALFEESYRLRFELSSHKKNIDVLQCLFNIAALHDQLGHFTRAQSFYDEIIDFLQVSQMESHALYLESVANKGITLFNQGFYQKAIQSFNQTIELKKKKYGQHHPSVAHTVHNLALAHHRLGQIKKAIKTYEEALKIYSIKYDQEHPYVRTLLANLENTQKFEDQ